MINPHAFHIALFFYDRAPQNAHALFIIYRLTFALWFTLFWSFSMPFSPFPAFPLPPFTRRRTGRRQKKRKAMINTKERLLSFFLCKCHTTMTGFFGNQTGQ